MKNTITGVAIGIAVTIIGFQFWFMFNIGKQVNQQGQTLQQVVTFLSQATGQNTAGEQPTVNK